MVKSSKQLKVYTYSIYKMVFVATFFFTSHHIFTCCVAFVMI